MERTTPDIDRGWAWVVMVAVYAGTLIRCSSMYMSGVIYTELLARFQKGPTVTSLVGAVSYGLSCMAAPLASVVINKSSSRVGLVIGGVLCTLGFVLGAFVTNLNLMIVTAGVLVGLGYAFTTAGQVCAAGYCFERRRDCILSANFVLVGCGMFFAVPFGLYLFRTQGLSGTFVVLASMHAQICVTAMICKPSSLEKKIHCDKKLLGKRKAECSNSSYFDIMLLKQKYLMCFLCSTSASCFALISGIMHLPNYISTLGGSDITINMVMTSLAIGNIIGRSVATFAVSKMHSKGVLVYSISLILSGIISAVFPLYSNLPGGLYVFATQLGMFCGIPNAMMTSLSIAFVGASKLAESYGLTFLFSGFGTIIGPVVVGYIYDVGGSYEYSFITAGVVLLTGGMLGMAAMYWHTPIEIDDQPSPAIDDGKLLEKPGSSSTLFNVSHPCLKLDGGTLHENNESSPMLCNDVTRDSDTETFL